MKRVLSVALAALMLLTLAACGSSQEPEPKVEEKASLSETAEALGYELLEINTTGTTLQYESTAVVDDNIGQVVYKNGKSTVTLRMTLDKEKGEGLAGFHNAGTAGAIEAPTDVFSKLSIQVVDSNTYFCEFNYTNCGCTCYLSLAETKTNLDLYSLLLIDYVNQLYNMEGIPGYVYAVDPNLALEDKAPETSASTSQAEASQSPAEQSGEPQPEPDEETVKTPEEQAAEEEAARQAAEEEAARQAAEEEAARKAAEEEAARKAAEEEAARQAAEAEAAQKAAEEEAAQQAAEGEKPQAEGTITLTYYDITLVSIGDFYTFEPKGGSGGYTWKSENKKVATVSEDGTVKAVGKGTTKVTVTSGDGLTAEVIVRVPAK